MKSKLFVLFTFMVASCTSVFASFNVSNDDTIQASTSDSSISNGNKHKVEFIYDGIVKKTMYVEDGTTLTSKDAPYEYSWYDSDNNGVVENFVDWEYNGDSLTNHIVVNSDIVVTGTQQDVSNFIKAVTSELPNNRPTHKQVSGSYGTAEYNDYFEEASISSVVLPNSITAYACNTYGGTNNNSSDWVTNVSADDLNSTVIFNYEFSSGLKEPSSSAIHVGLGEETSVSGYENYLSDFCNATYKLTNDVYLLDLVEGDNGISITLGAVTGYAGNKKDGSDAMPQRFYQGIILKNYTSLDLNGYDLIVGPNTTLDAWGYVNDSVGTGTVVLESGSTMYTPFVVEDHYRQDHMPAAYVYNANPFYMYRCPYIDCNLRIKVGANFNGKYRLAFASSGAFINGDFALIGNDENALYRIQKNDNTSETSEAYVERKVVDNSSLFGGNSMNTMIKLNWAYKKVELSFYNLDVTFNKLNNIWNDGVNQGIDINLDFPLGGMEFAINSDKYPFVISPYYNLYFYNSIFNLNQLLIFMPGSNLLFDENSVLNLGYSNEKTMEEIEATIIFVPVSFAKEQSYQSVGGIFMMDYFDIDALNYFSKYKVNESAPSTTYIFNENKTYFTCINKTPARCDFYGKIDFIENSSGVSQYHPFSLAGNMNIYDLDSFKASIEKAQTSGLDVELSANYFFTSSNNFLNALSPSVTLNIVFFDNSPLISNGYVLTPVDSDEVLNDKRMTYDKTSKLIKYVDGTTTTYYGYKLADDTSMANSYKMSNLNGTDSLAGTYTKLDSYSNGVAEFSSSSYINLSGVFLPFNDNGQVNVRKLAEGSGVSGDRFFNCTYNNGVWALA